MRRADFCWGKVACMDVLSAGLLAELLNYARIVACQGARMEFLYGALAFCHIYQNESDAHRVVAEVS